MSPVVYLGTVVGVSKSEQVGLHIRLLMPMPATLLHWNPPPVPNTWPQRSLSPAPITRLLSQSKSLSRIPKRSLLSQRNSLSRIPKRSLLQQRNLSPPVPNTLLQHLLPLSPKTSSQKSSAASNKSSHLRLSPMPNTPRQRPVPSIHPGPLKAILSIPATSSLSLLLHLFLQELIITPYSFYILSQAHYYYIQNCTKCYGCPKKIFIIRLLSEERWR